MRKVLGFIIVMIGFSSLIFSQEISVKGKVSSDSDNLGIPGVNVRIQDTNQGTITDVDGNYELKVPSSSSVLVFSFVGYKTSEVRVGSQSIINVVLAESAKSLDEVVVVGYGKMKKSDLTGSVSSIKTEDLKDMPIIGIDQALQGRAAGVFVTNNTGAPGSSVSIQIRGIGSINKSNEPLYVIDGIPLDNTQIANPQTGGRGDKINPMANINPDEIESMEILKDPASCAIYGARGANGVVLITTKRGKKGKAVIQLNSYYGTSEATNNLDLLNSSDYQRLVYEGLRKKRIPIASPLYITDEEVEKYNTSWQDAVFRKASTYNVDLSASGGNENMNYMVSGGYYSNEGIIINTGFKRYSLRSNLDINVSKRVKIGTNLAFSHSDGQRQRNSLSNASIENNKKTGGPVLMSALTSSPVVPVYEAPGVYGFDLRNRAIANPVMLANEQNLDYFTNRLLGNVNLSIDIVKGLNFSSSLGGDLRNTKENFFWGPYNYPDDGLPMPGSARTSDNNVNGFSWVWTNMLNYKNEFGDHSINALVAHEASRIQNQLTYTEVGGMTISKINTFASSPAKLTSQNYKSASSLESYFGRVNYSYKGKYLVQANIRTDGSSRFGPEVRWAVFPAASIGWNMAKESFMGNLNFLNELKWRVSYGKTGNQEVGDYSWRGTYVVGTLPNAYDVDGVVLNYLSMTGGKFQTISVYDYSWESQTTLDIGLDVSLFRNRLFFSADFYNRVSNGLLLDVSLPITTGVYSATNNAGEVTNKGFEFSFTSRNIVTNDFEWTTDFNISTNKFMVNHLITDSLKAYNTMLIEGQPLNFFTYEREEYVDSLTGHVVLIDQNGDGKISYGGGNDDKTITGSPLPKFFGGITNTFRYKGFDFSFFFQFVYGNQLYNATRQTLEDLQVPPGLNVGVNCTQLAFDDRYLATDVVDEDGNIIWKRNVHTIYPTTNFSGNNIDQREGHNGWIEDGSYIRLKTLTFGYSFPKSWMNSIHLNGLRLYFSSNNLLTFTNYSGLDPEVNTYSGGGTGGILSQGIDAGAYPQAKTFIFGLNVTF